MSTIVQSDAQLREDVIGEIEFDPAVTVTDIVVIVHNGVVTLEGLSDSYGSLISAQDAAWRVHGVMDVVNNIKVNPKLLGLPDDDEIAKDLRHRLEKDFLVPSGQITVSVEDGVVTLRGTVRLHLQREAAREEAQQTKGVRFVNNFIEISRDMPSPKSIGLDIERALARSAQVDAKNIRVTADGGHVTLSGTVRSYAERTEAVDAAWRAKGVTNVTDHIVIEPF